MKKIAVFHTGGTIAMEKDDNASVNITGGNAITEITAAAFKDNFLDNTQIKLLEHETPIFGAPIPSPYITEEHMLKLRKAILNKIKTDDIDGVVITHGTDTLEETAYFLDITVPHTIPVVLTGAMRPANETGSDAVKNYQCAIKVDASDQAKNMGTMVVMNEEIHAARSVTKTHTTNLSTFKSPDLGHIGTIAADGTVIFNRILPTTPCYEVDALTKKVLLVKAYAGIDSLIFNAIETLPIDGLVIEALGAGNVPASIVPCLQKIEKRGIPIIIASRCVSGMAQPIYSYPGGGKSLKDEELKSVIFASGLSGAKARLKLAVVLENFSNLEDIEAEFAR